MPSLVNGGGSYWWEIQTFAAGWYRLDMVTVSTMVSLLLKLETQFGGKTFSRSTLNLRKTNTSSKQQCGWKRDVEAFSGSRKTIGGGINSKEEIPKTFSAISTEEHQGRSHGRVDEWGKEVVLHMASKNEYAGTELGGESLQGHWRSTPSARSAWFMEVVSIKGWSLLCPFNVQSVARSNCGENGLCVRFDMEFSDTFKCKCLYMEGDSW